MATKHKLAYLLIPGDRLICADTGKPARVKTIGRGMINGFLLVTHTAGWTNIPRDSEVEIS